MCNRSRHKPPSGPSSRALSSPTPNFLWKHPYEWMGVDGKQRVSPLPSNPSSLYLATWSKRNTIRVYSDDSWDGAKSAVVSQAADRLGMHEDVYCHGHKKIPSIWISFIPWILIKINWESESFSETLIKEIVNGGNSVNFNQCLMQITRQCI